MVEVVELGDVESTELIQEVLFRKNELPEDLVLCAVRELAHKCAEGIFYWVNHPENIDVLDLAVDGSQVYAVACYRDEKIPFFFTIFSGVP